MDNWQGALIRIFDPSALDGTAIWIHEDAEKEDIHLLPCAHGEDRIWSRVGIRECKHSAVQSAIVCLNCASVGIPSFWDEALCASWLIKNLVQMLCLYI